MAAFASPQRLRQELPALDWIDDEGLVTRLSQDYSWFSPILTRQLSSRRGDMAVRPRSVEELQAVVAACARHHVALTIRGSGTGNYGQCTPLHGGLVVDMTALNRVCHVREGCVRAQAGARLGSLEAAAREQGMELRMLPSTFRSASVGGLFGGGFGGVGSINYGPLGAAGNILGIQAMTVGPEPARVELRGADAVAMHHLWGTVGIAVEVELALAPAQPWIEIVATFADRDATLAFADRLAHAPGLAKRNVCVLLQPVPGLLARLSDALPPGEHAVLAVVSAVSEPAFQALLAEHGGKVRLRQDEEQVRRSHRSIIEFCWNHTTLHALKTDRTLTYLQNSFTAGQHLKQLDALACVLGDEVLWHLEFIRSFDGPTTCTALPLVRWQGQERLEEIIALMRAQGVRVNNPHVNTVEDGKFGGVLPPGVLELKRRFDPLGLLNPGKLRSWPVAIDAPAR